MRKNITPEQARAMLRSTEQLRDAGISERSLRAAVLSGALHRVRPGWFVTEEQWGSLWPEGRQLMRLIAADRDSPAGVIAVGVSAGALWGLPFYRLDPQSVHLAIPTPAASRSTPGVRRHRIDLPDDDIVVRHGIRCTSPRRTVLDLASTLPPEAALACADAALRRVAVTGRTQNEERAAAWRDELGALAADSHARGIRQARRIIALSDGRADSTGESVSRLQLYRLGFRRVSLQVTFARPGVGLYLVDFGLDDVGALGEFDGRGKYLDPELSGGRNAGQVVLDEKDREDWIRGVFQGPFARWGGEHIRTADTLGERLAAFGIRPPSCPGRIFTQ